jgi:hypothetical protein
MKNEQYDGLLRQLKTLNEIAETQSEFLKKHFEEQSNDIGNILWTSRAVLFLLGGIVIAFIGRSQGWWFFFF